MAEEDFSSIEESSDNSDHIIIIFITIKIRISPLNQNFKLSCFQDCKKYF